jgi:hypothetical protein
MTRARTYAYALIVSLVFAAIVVQRPLVVAQSTAGALQFNGSNQYVTFGAAPGLGAATFTLELWFKRTGAGATTTTGSGGVTAVPLLTKGRGEAENSNVDMNYFLGIDGTSGKLVADFEEGAGQTSPGLNHPITAGTVVTSNVWHHAAVTYESSTGVWKIYLDGVQDATAIVGANRAPRSDSIQHAALGTAMTSTGLAAGFFQGIVDEARIWNVARTAADVQAGMNQEISSAAGLIGRWGMNEGSGTTIAGVGPNGTLTNAPTWTFDSPFNTVPPSAPQSVSASAGKSLVTLAWVKNAEPDVVGYNVYRSTTSPVLTGGPPLNGATLVSNPIYTDRNLTNGTTYYYAVTAVDASGNVSAPSAEATATPDPNAGAAVEFNGANQYVTFGVANGLGTSTFTLETWFKRSGNGAGTNTGSGGISDVIPLVSKGRAEAEGSNVDMNYILGIQASTGVLAADFEDTVNGGNHPVLGLTAIPVSTTTWHHAAATYDGTTWRLYLDGVLDKTLSVGNFTPRFDSIQHAGIATAFTSNGVAAGFFAGIQDEVRIWNYARSQAEIQSTMQQELLTAPGLIGRWGLNEATGTNAANTAATIPGTLTNGAGWVAGYPFTPDATPPSAPQNLVASAGNNTVGLNWTPNTEADLAGYNVYRSTTTPVPISTPLNGATLLTLPAFTDNAVSNGTTYHYVVTAVDTFGNTSDPSNEASASPLAPNQPPFVNAGPDQTIALPSTAALNGTVSDPDGSPGPLTVTWTKVSGPGTVTFANPNSASTTATFPSAGTYVLRLGANDGAATANDDATIAVSDPIIVGAGDIAPDCGIGQSTANAEATAALLDGIPGTVFTLGDNAYTDGTAAQFANCYGPTWGRHWSRTRPATGNHDYHQPNATPYFDYFNGPGNQTGPAGDRSGGYYSYDIGAWHVVVLNSECAEPPASPTGLWQPGGCAVGSPQETWLRADLAASTTNNIIAIWHKPRFSSSSADATDAFLQPLWQALYEYGIDIILGGHWHNYERLAPTNANGVADTAYGIRQFVVGTGGVPITGFGTIRSTSEARNSDTHGVLKLTLHADSYDWQFIPVAGKTFTDSGTSAVHGPPPPPTVTGITPTIGAAAGGTTVTIAGTNFGLITPTGIAFGSSGSANVSCSSSAQCTATSPAGTGTVDVRVTVGGQTSAAVTADRFTYNQSPAVNAGPDQTITLPADATMAGTMSDDGVPSPLTAIWSKVSGPGSVTFANPSSPTTTVSFPQSGSYVLRLSASDGLQSASDDVAVTVNAAPPMATALSFNGTNQYVTFGPAPGLGAPTFTLEVWFKRAGTGAGTSTGSGGVTAEPLLAKGRAEAEGSNVDMNYFLGIDGAKRVLVADFEDSATGANHPISGTTAICDDLWYHAAATYDGTIWRLYLNGALEAQSTVGSFTPRSDSIQHAALATAMNSTGVASGFFNGLIDEARIWNSARSAAQIASGMGTEITAAAGLIGRWGLNEGFGTVTEDSAGATSGTLTNGPSWVAGSPFAPTVLPPGNYGLELSGSATAKDYVTFGAAAGLGASTFTLETWFKREGAGVATSTGSGGVTAVPLITKGMAEADGTNQDMNYFLGIRAADNVLVADFEDAATGGNHPIIGTTAVTNGVWHHVAATYDGSTWTLYLDGVADATFAVGSVTPRADSIQHAAIGTALNSTGAVGTQTQGFFDGVLDEPRIWNYARSAAQIASGMGRPISTASGLLGRWSLDTPCAVTIADSTGNGNNGTLVGSGWRCVAGAPVNGAVNQVPSVDAGADQTVTLPASASLNGVVTDDDVTGTLATTWSLVSGPGTVTFANPASTSTTASFSAAGSYVLQLAATDGELSATDTLTVTVNPSGPVNQAPVVNAGADQAITLPAAASLSGTVTDDGLPGTDVTTTWSTVSGPGTVTFGDATSTTTTAAFSAAGAYVLQLSASDGALSSSDTLTVTVTTAAAGNGAIDFGGTNTYVALGPAPGLGSPTFTLELWFKREGSGVATNTGTSGIDAVPLVSKGRAQSDGSNLDMNYFFGIANNVLAADFEEGATGASPGLNHPVSGSATIANNFWYHAAATYDGTRWRVYLNGALDAELTVGQPPRADSIQHAAIASALTSTGAAAGFFDGVIDEVRIWNYARTQQQIKDSMNLEISSASGLLGRWGFNEGSGTTVVDSVGNNTGTISGTNFTRVAGTTFRSNQPPAQPTLNAPSNGATGVSTSPTLNVGVTDGDGDPLTVTFLGRPVQAGTAPDFTIVAIPDTQHYVDDATRAPTFTAQTQWIVDNRAALNIAFVSHLGDIVEHIDAVPEEWSRANTSLTLLDTNNFKWGLAPGNHDMSSAGVATNYDLNFPVSRFEGHNWYGGYLGKDPVNDPVNRQNKNNYELFSVGGLDFLVIHLEYDMPGYSVAWADRILKQYPNRRAIISTHLFLNASGVRPSTVLNRTDGTPAETVWQQIIRTNCNVFLVLNGHYPGEANRTDLNACGQPVHQLESDYQSRTNGGDGFLRYMTFKPSENKIYVYTFSPTLNGGAGQFETDANSQFVLDYHMQGTAYTTIATNAGVLSGSNSAATWPNLGGASEYEWYVTVSDGQVTTTSPVWRFTTGSPNGAPVVTNPGNQSNAEGASVNLPIQATDPDGDTLTYSATGLPTGLSIGTGVISGTIAVGAATTNNVTVTVSDGSATGTASFVWTVTRTNRAPVANAQSVTTPEDTAKAITLTASDADGDALTLSIVTAPAHGTLSGNAPDVTYTPAANYSGPDSFTFRANDGTADSAAATVSLTVTPTPDAPAVIDPGNQTSAEGASVSLQIQASDPDGDALTYSATGLPAGLSIGSGTGTISGTVAFGAAPTNNVTVTVTDGSLTGMASFVWAVTNTNQAPVADAQSVTTPEDTPKAITLTGSDADGDALTFSIATAPVHGTLSGTAPNVTYTPAANYSGTDSFTFRTNDGTANSAPATASLTVLPAPDPPVITNPGNQTHAEGASVSLQIQASDPDGESLAYGAAGLPAGLTIGASTGLISGTVAFTASGSYNVTVTVTDPTAAPASTAFTWTITDTNRPPVAASATFSTPKNRALTADLTATDPDGDPVTYALVAQGRKGTAVINTQTGEFTYTPAGNANGTDTFTFKANDGNVDSNVAIVTIRFTTASANTPPVASNGTLATSEDTSASNALVASDIDGNPLTYRIVTNGSKGTATITNASTGAYSYVPQPNANGTDTFTFVANDGTADSNTATVNVTIAPVNDPPVANNDTATTSVNTPVTIGVIANDSDPDGDALTIVSLTQGAHGAVVIDQSQVVYTPAADYVGPDTFTYKAQDSSGLTSAAATVTVNVTGPNQPPVAQGQAVTTAEDATRAMMLTGTDAEGQPLTFSIVAPPTHGVLSGTAPNVTYTPATDYNGTDSFTFRVNDGVADSAPATVSITITALNDAPVASDGAVSTTKGTPADGSLIALDVDNPSLTYSIVTQPKKGTLVLNASTGAFTYTPNSNVKGNDSFTFQASDGSLFSNTAKIAVTVK